MTRPSSPDHDFAALVDMFMDAPFTPTGWYDALADLAERTGSSFGQMIGIGASTTRFNILTGHSRDELTRYAREFDDQGFYRPDTNWRVAASRIHGGALVSERDYDALRTQSRFEAYEEHLRYWRGVNGCQANLLTGDGELVGLALLRTEADGRIEAGQLTLIERLIPVIRGAVRLQMSLGRHETGLLAESLAGMGAAALLCDRGGYIKATTPAGERELVTARYLKMRDGRPLPCVSRSRPPFERGLGAMLGAEGGAAAQRVWLRDAADPHSGCVCEIHALPAREFDLGFAPRVLIVLRVPGELGGSSAALLAAAYGLSPAEAEIALLLATGLSRAQIATQRGASPQTVASQLRTIFRKCDVTREGELVALMNRLLR